jgi:hypothetical protein
MIIDCIYLNKGTDTGSNHLDNWVYYRVCSVDAAGETAGHEGSNVQVCQISWPDLQDKTGFEKGEGWRKL